MKGYLLALVGAILLSALVSALASDRKMGKFIKGMARIFVFSVVAVPMLSLFRGEGPAWAEEPIGQDEGYLARCAELLAAEREEDAERFLLETFSLTAEVRAELGGEYGLTCEKITAILSRKGIIGQDEHIDMIARAEEALKERYGCAAEVVWSDS